MWVRLGCLVGVLLISGCAAGLRTNDSDMSRARQQVIDAARTMNKMPYRYGGNSPRTGFDCSGLVQFAAARAGAQVPRDTRSQYSALARIKKARPGDVLFFAIDARPVSHVGIYTGRGRMIHAPGQGRVVSEVNVMHPYWQDRFVHAAVLLP